MPRGERSCAVIAAVLIPLAAASASAHEPGTTQVAVTFQRDASFEITILTDAAALVEKMEAAAGTPRRTGDSPSELRRRLDAVRDLFLKKVSITFDDAAVEPESATFAVSDGTSLDPPAATVTMTGKRPAARSAFRWTYGWTFTPYAFRVSRPGAAESTSAWLEGGTASEAVALDMPQLPPGRMEIGGRYVVLGFTHLVPEGLQHILFVLGLFLLGRGPRPIVTQLGAFSLAHSLALALGVYGLLTIPPHLLHTLIAFSVAWIALENIAFESHQRRHVALAFVFGLLHGLSFTEGFRAMASPSSELIPALAGFNIGIETGQLAVVATAFLLIGWSWSPRPWYRARVVIPTSALIASTAVYLVLERL